MPLVDGSKLTKFAVKSTSSWYLVIMVSSILSNSRVYGRQTFRSIKINKTGKENLLKTYKAQPAINNVFNSGSSPSSGDSSFEKIKKTRARYASRTQPASKQTNDTSSSSITESEVSSERNRSIGLFKTPKKTVEVLKRNTRKGKYKCYKTKKKARKSRRLKQPEEAVQPSFENDTSQDDELPGEHLMAKFDIRNTRKNVPTAEEPVISFSEFDNYSLIVETADAKDENQEKKLNFCDLQNLSKFNSKLSPHASLPSKDERKIKKFKLSKLLSEQNLKKEIENTVCKVQVQNCISKNERNLHSYHNLNTSTIPASSVDSLRPNDSLSENVKSRSDESSPMAFASGCVSQSLKRTPPFTNPIYASTPQALPSRRHPLLKQGNPLKMLSPVTTASDSSSARFSDATFLPSRKRSSAFADTKTLNNVCEQLNLSLKLLLGSCEKKDVAKNHISTASDVLKLRNSSSFNMENDSKLNSIPVVNLRKLSLGHSKNLGKKRSSFVHNRRSKRERPCELTSSFLCPVLTTDHLQQTFVEALTVCVDEDVSSARAAVLKQCRQKVPMPFEEYVQMRTTDKCVKIGEGTYGEVFSFNTNDELNIVTKFVPVEGSQLICDSPQKTFQEILSEVVVSIELSSLRDTGYHSSPNFILVHRILCTCGEYPQLFLQAWDEFDTKNNSENDRPDFFPCDQLYIAFEFSNGGTDLEHFEFQNAKQAVSVFIQVACALAVAENTFKFEHRDLHWGNILIAHTNDPNVVYSLHGEEIEVDSHGLLVTIIDFTLSRMDKDGLTVYCDLSTSDNAAVFTGEGEYQFEVYRLMKKHTRNKWSGYYPYTNVLWLNYLLKKLIFEKKYKNKRSKMHLKAMADLKKWNSKVLDNDTTQNVIYNCKLIQ